jgi:hypothetical protein
MDEQAATKVIVRAGGSQRGVALFVALMILVIISILGMSALRTSVTNARITTGIQIGTLGFQGAQTAINGAIDEMTGPTAGQTGNLLTAMLTARTQGLVQIQYRCVTPSDLSVAASAAPSCSATQFADSRDLVQAGSESILMQTMAPAPGWTLSGPGAYGYNQIVVAGTGAVPSMGVTNTNVQNLALLGPKPQGELNLNN